MDPLLRDDLSARRTEGDCVLLEELASPHRHVAVAVARYDEAAVNGGEDPEIRELAAVALGEFGQVARALDEFVRQRAVPLAGGAMNSAWP